MNTPDGSGETVPKIANVVGAPGRPYIFMRHRVRHRRMRDCFENADLKSPGLAASLATYPGLFLCPIKGHLQALV